MNTKQKIKIILKFSFLYFLMLFVLVFIFGNYLLGIEEKIIYFLLKENINYEAFEFVVYCSGVVSVSAYLAGVISLTNKENLKERVKPVVVSVILLFMINLLRIIVVMLSEKLNLQHTVHIISWFFMLFVVVYLIEISLREKMKK